MRPFSRKARAPAAAGAVPIIGRMNLLCPRATPPSARMGALLLAGALLAACSPTLNWRELPLPPTDAVALLPCKPDHATRSVPLGGVPTELTVAGCEAGGALFALMAATLPAGRAPDDALAGWQQATLDNLRAQGAPQRSPFVPPHGLPLPHAQRLVVSGRHSDGTAVAAEAVWTARAAPGGGTQLLHAVVYAPSARPEAASTFFAGIRWP